jgi:DNA-binding NarL/FixJ family response regulator
MRNPELIVFGMDESGVAALAEWGVPRSVRVRPVRKPESCLQLLREGHARAVLLRVGRDLPAELEMIAQISAGFPQVAVLVIEDASHAELRSMLWDLGACLVASSRRHADIMDTLEQAFCGPRTGSALV